MLNDSYFDVMHIALSCKVNIPICNTQNIMCHLLTVGTSWVYIWLHRNGIINITTLYAITTVAMRARTCVFISAGRGGGI